jgi:protein-S-isoprenylcysteine O-methyltransferase Ste14
MTTLPVWLRAAAFIVVVPGAIAGWLPWWIAGAPPLPPAPWPSPRTTGVAIAALGWGVLLWCARDFARRGRGTPAPYDPPRALVTSGLYRYVRNPMYVGVLTAILGQAWWYRSTGVLAYAAVIALMFHLRVVLYEEPRLARDFGADFDAYRARVPRWLPRRPRG